MTLEELRIKQKELTERRASLRAELSANQERRAALAFDAECGEPQARKEVDALIKAAQRMDGELESLAAALIEAARRIAAAESALADGAQRKNAAEALALLDEFEARGAKLTVALADFLREYGALTDDFRKLERLEFPPTTYALVAINMKRAVASALHDTDLKQDHLSPRERTTFAAVIKGWAGGVRARAAAVVNKKPTAKVA